MFLLKTSPLLPLRTFCSKTFPILTLFTKLDADFEKQMNPTGVVLHVLFGPDPCPLCDEAKQVLEPLRHRFVFEQVDISRPENRVWLDRYRWDIPVFHLNGRLVMKHRVDLDLLDRLLRDAEMGQT